MPPRLRFSDAIPVSPSKMVDVDDVDDVDPRTNGGISIANDGWFHRKSIDSWWIHDAWRWQFWWVINGVCLKTDYPYPYPYPQIWWLMIMSMLKWPGTGLSSVSRQTHGSFCMWRFFMRNPPKQGQFVNPWVLHCNHENHYLCWGTHHF